MATTTGILPSMQVHKVQRSPIDDSSWATEDGQREETPSFRGSRSGESLDRSNQGLSHWQHPQAGTKDQ